ncbi:hypothetical protein [Leptospira mayottensis]|uniref:hypothetical protein n=1 Tax=Leptospira mayottensis TaxID=1137606 RepID=UPI001C1F5F1C
MDLYFYNSNIYVKAGDDGSKARNLPYRLPFESSSRVGQGYNGKFHTYGNIHLRA